jgi:hypothetical protein
MVQKCTDIDCKGYESESVEIPEDILSELRRKYAENVAFTSQKPKSIKLDMESILAEIERDLSESDSDLEECLKDRCVKDGERVKES